MTKICTHCRTVQYDDNAQFCGHCGHTDFKELRARKIFRIDLCYCPNCKIVYYPGELSYKRDECIHCNLSILSKVRNIDKSKLDEYVIVCECGIKYYAKENPWEFCMTCGEKLKRKD